MQVKVLCQIAVALLLLVAWAACGPQQGAAPDLVEEGEALVVDSVLAAEVGSLTQEPLARLQSARANLRRRDGQAAADLGRVAALLREHAAAASNYVRRDVDAAAADLEGLAERAQRGARIQEKEADGVLAHANLALAGYHRQQAAEAWTRAEARQAAVHLNAAAVYVHGAAGLLRAQGGLDVGYLVEELKALAGRLTQGADTPDRIQNGIEDLGEEIASVIQQTRQPS